MNEQEMKKLSRGDLLELLLTQGKENERLRAQLQEAEKKLLDRRVKINESGSLAEAMLKINGMIEAAQQTADEYLENIRIREEESSSKAAAALQTAEKQSSIIVQEAESKAAEMIKSAEEMAAVKLKETEEKCAAMEANAKTMSDKYWSEVSEKMEAFYQAHQGLKELLSVVNKQD